MPETRRRAWGEWLTRQAIFLILSLLGTAVVVAYLYLIFWQVHLPAWFASWERAINEWGMLFAVLFVYIILKGPRLFMQVPGDEKIAITQGLLTMIPIFFLGMIVGRTAAPGIHFPPNGQLVFWVMLCALVVFFSTEIYVSIRYAEKTLEGGLVPPT